MSAEDDNKALIRRYVDSLNQKKLPSEEFVDPGFVFHNPGLPDVTTFADARRVVFLIMLFQMRTALSRTSLQRGTRRFAVTRPP